MFPLLVLIGYLICFLKPNMIWSHVFDCTWSSLLVFTLSFHWLSNLFPKTKQDLVTHIWLRLRSWLVFTLSSDWVSNPFPKFKLNLVTSLLLHMSSLLAITLSSHWLPLTFVLAILMAIVTTLVFQFLTMNQNPLLISTNLTEILTWFSFLLWICLQHLGYFHLTRLEGN